MKTLIFDFDGVFVPDEYQVIRSICPDEAAIIRLEEPFYAVPDSTPFWEQLRQHFKLHLGDEELMGLYNKEDDQQLAQVNELLGLVKEWSKTHQLVLLSNQINDRTQYLRQTHDFSSFHHVFFSSEIGLSKPDPKVFEFVLNAIGAKPQDCIFIDDAQENLDAASMLGIRGIHFQSIEQLKGELSTS